MGFELDRFLEKERIPSELICSICTDILEDPVQTPCEHNYCSDCINRWLKGQLRGQRTCPEDRKPLASDELRPANRLTRQLLSSLIVRCKHYSDGCCLMSKFEDMPRLVEHETNQCPVVLNGRMDGQKTRIEVLERQIQEDERKIAELTK